MLRKYVAEPGTKKKDPNVHARTSRRNGSASHKNLVLNSSSATFIQS